MNPVARASVEILGAGLMLLATVGPASLVLAGEPPSNAKVAQEADAILAERFKDGLPGAAARADRGQQSEPGRGKARADECHVAVLR